MNHAYLERLAAAKLLSLDTLRALRQDAALSQLTPTQLAQELVRRKLISKYQSRVLLRPGTPTFDYGPYRVVGRYTAGFRSGLFQAIHRSSGQRVDLDRFTTRTDLAELTVPRHANLACCIDVFHEADRSHVVLEQVAGPTLADHLSQDATPLDNMTQAIRQVAEACWVFHANSQTHGMICPASVWIDNEGQAKLGWRPGRSLAADDPISQRLWSLVAPSAAPELDVNAPTPAADVYAIGSLLQQTLSRMDRPSKSLVGLAKRAYTTSKSSICARGGGCGGDH